MTSLKHIAMRLLPPVLVPKAWGSPFEAANWSPRRGMVPGASPTDARNELTPGVRTELVRKSRYMHKNSGFMRELVANMAIYSTGDGIRVQAQSPKPEWNRAAEAYFALWSARCEVTRRFSFEECQALVCRGMDIDGEYFIHKTRDAEGEPGDRRTYTYWDLYREVNLAANMLKKLGVVKGDRVAIYLPMIPEAVIAMLACARIGAVHTVVFGGFSPESLRDRINDCGCKVLITADGGYRRGQIVPLKRNADEAIKECPTIEHVLVVMRRRSGVGDETFAEMEEGRDQSQATQGEREQEGAHHTTCQSVASTSACDVTHGTSPLSAVFIAMNGSHVPTALLLSRRENSSTRVGSHSSAVAATNIRTGADTGAGIMLGHPPPCVLLL